ncbi:MAG TPA: DapH/DapD/GlmU-related protein [Phycisphaerae bacterium]|nr:DapH/DapD/GlmU-related protein [Phycisphaerae bacterium]
MTIATATPHDSRLCLQGFLLLDVCARLFIWSTSLTLTIATMTALNGWPEESIVGAGPRLAWIWGQKLTHLVLLFNLYYVACLVVLRLTVPTPKEGSYSMMPGSPLDRNLIYSVFIAVLTKARYHAPFPGFLVFHIANLPPMRWLMNPVFGPKSRSCYVLDPIIGDPHLTEIGRNVVFGFNSSVTCHTQQRDSITIRKVVIGDDVLIGANAVVFSGCKIGRGAVVLSGAVVPPDTVIGEYEVWGGLPARKIKDLPPPGAM